MFLDFKLYHDVIYMFVHLHNHSHYSILEGLPKPGEYVKKAVAEGSIAVAITDSSNVHGCHELYSICKKEGITPILGTEILVQSSLDEKLNHKLVLLAKSLRGYKNIISLVSKANLDNSSHSAFIKIEDIKELKNTSKNSNLEIVCLSGPISGEIPYYILTGQSEEKILSKINEYKDIFGEENYFLELIYHDDIPKQNFVTDKLIEIHKKYDLEVVATNNCHYINKDDKETQDVIMALGTGHQLENPDRNTLINGNYSYLSEEEMHSLFGFIPSALSNTVKIAKMVDIEIETGGILIPKFELPEEHAKIFEEAKNLESDITNIKKLSSDEWYLRYLSFEGLNWRYKANISRDLIFKLVQKLDKPSLDKKLVETSPEELKELSLVYYSDEKKEILKTFSQDIQDKIERLEYELVVVHEMGFDAYFLIVADYINWARANDIPVGPGRGSAAGSLMAFTSGITDIDPLPYGLIFERFLNPARVSMPDIDTDFADTERDRVIKYCSEKYGADKVVNICTFGTFAARAAVKDVGRVMGVNFSEMNSLVKLIPEKPGTKLKGALEDSVEFKDAYDNNKLYKKIIDNALRIEGNVRQLGVHACAVIIAPESMTNFCALQHPPKDSEAVVTQYSAYPLEDLGLLKMDFLGLRNLTIIKRCQKIVKNNIGKDIDILAIPLDESEVFKIFADGDTTGVFQFESEGMRKYLRDLAPNAFEDLIAMVSLYRPGPLAYIPAYIDRKYGREEIKYMTSDLVEILKKVKSSDDEIEKQKILLEEDLKKILDVTYGIAVYQEQLMFIVQYMAGFSLGEADLLRRGVGKKKLDVIEALKIEFIEKSKNFRGYKPEVSKYIYEEMIQPAANYSFNKSHAACYAFIAYQTAYLKAHHRTEFLTSIMVSDEDNMERIVMEVGECEQYGISVLPPSINQSLKHFTYIDNDNIRFGLKAIKGIGDGPIDKIIESRKQGEYKNLEDFIERVGKEVINKKSLEALIKSGAMDNLGDRATMFESIEDMIKYVKRDEKKKETNQIGLFDLTGGVSGGFEDKLELKENVKAMSYEQLLSGEKEMIGFCVSGHALDGLGRYCDRRSNNTKKLKLSFDELSKLPEYQKEIETDKKEKKKTEAKQEIVQAIGIVVNLRKIITKTGKPMLFLKCEGFDYEFEIVIFPKDVEKYIDKVSEDKIVIVTGVFNVNLEYSRKSIQLRDLKIASISQIRDQAKDLGLYDENIKRFTNIKLNESKINEVKLEPKKEKYIIKVPSSAKKNDLHDLKAFLEFQEKGNYKIYLNIKGQEIYTKLDVANLQNTINWTKSKWA